MRNLLWTALMIGSLGTLQAETVTICYMPATYVLNFTQARPVVGRIYQNADIQFKWQRESARHPCPVDAVVITVQEHTPEKDHPGALAYALPYEGTQIVVLFDRILKATEASQTSSLLAHVLAHEIGHIFQGVSRHSDRGVMKAHWNREDFRLMALRPYDFTDVDVMLIHSGLARRTSAIQVASAK